MDTTERKAGQQLPVIVFTLAYMGAAIIAAIANRNMEFVFYIAVMFVLIAVVWFLYLRVGLSGEVLMALSVWGALHMGGGLIAVPEDWPISGNQYVLYSLWLIPGHLKYDQIVHAYGFGVTTWVCWQCLRSALGSSARPTFGLAVLCAAAGLGFGALNEVIEFFATLLMPSTNVGGYINTGWDLVANTVGATTAAGLIWLNGQR